MGFITPVKPKVRRHNPVAIRNKAIEDERLQKIMGSAVSKEGSPRVFRLEGSDEVEPADWNDEDAWYRHLTLPENRSLLSELEASEEAIEFSDDDSITDFKVPVSNSATKAIKIYLYSGIKGIESLCSAIVTTLSNYLSLLSRTLLSNIVVILLAVTLASSIFLGAKYAPSLRELKLPLKFKLPQLIPQPDTLHELQEEISDHAYHIERLYSFAEKKSDDYSVEPIQSLKVRINELEEEIKVLRKLLKVQAAEGKMNSDSPLISHYETDSQMPYNFALYSSGARVNPFLTSDSFKQYPPGFTNQLIARLFGIGIKQGHQPAIAIHPDNNPGMCWPMSGNFGQLAVQLSTPTHPSAFSLAMSLQSDPNGNLTAPKDVELWVHLPDAHIRDMIKSIAPAYGKSTLPEEYVLVGSCQINGVSKKFSLCKLPEEIEKLNFSTSNVVLKVLNNWGNPLYTCIYQFMVYGGNMKLI